MSLLRHNRLVTIENSQVVDGGDYQLTQLGFDDSPTFAVRHCQTISCSGAQLLIQGLRPITMARCNRWIC